MTSRKLLLALTVSLMGMVSAGCGADENGAAPVVQVSAEQRAKDVNSEAEATVKWLEGMPPADRQAALDRTPQVKAKLKEVSDPSLKSRIAALGL